MYKCDHFEMNLPNKNNVLTQTVTDRRAGMDEQNVAQTANRSGQGTKLWEVLINEQEHFTECVACESHIISENMRGHKIHSPALHICRSY